MLNIQYQFENNENIFKLNLIYDQKISIEKQKEFLQEQIKNHLNEIKSKKINENNDNLYYLYSKEEKNFILIFDNIFKFNKNYIFLMKNCKLLSEDYINNLNYIIENNNNNNFEDEINFNNQKIKLKELPFKLIGHLKLNLNCSFFAEEFIQKNGISKLVDFIDITKGNTLNCALECFDNLLLYMNGIEYLIQKN